MLRFRTQQIAALSQVLSTPIRVAYLDRSGSAEGSEVEVDFHSFDVEGKGTEEGMTLLYRVSRVYPSSSTSPHYYLAEIPSAPPPPIFDTFSPVITTTFQRWT